MTLVTPRANKEEDRIPSDNSSGEHTRGRQACRPRCARPESGRSNHGNVSKQKIAGVGWEGNGDITDIPYRYSLRRLAATPPRNRGYGRQCHSVRVPFSRPRKKGP